MLITTRFRSVRHTDQLTRYIEWRIRAALDRVAYRIVAVAVHVERNQRFEVTCRIRAQVAESTHLIADGRNRIMLKAIDRAADNLADMVVRAMDRSRERQRRPRSAAHLESETSAR